MSPKTTAREWAGYVRVSKVMGREGDSFMSPSQQEAKIRAALRAQYDAEPTRVWVDLDRTGRDDDRPEFQAMLEWVEESPKTRGVAVMDGSRLFRNAELFLSTVKRLERSGAEFLSAHLLMDAKTPEGALMRTMDAAVNEFFSANIGRRWRQVLADRAARGDHPTGKTPYGYRREPDPADPKRQRVVPDEADGGGTADVVRKMYRWYCAGRGLREVAAGLNAEGVPSPGGSTWGVSTVKRTLESKAYVGVLEFKGEEHPASWGPLVPRDVREAYEAERARRTRAGRKHSSPKWALGSGLSVCGKCGGRLSVTSTTAPRGQAMCQDYRTKRSDCPGVFMLRGRFEGQFALALWACWQDRTARAVAAEHDAKSEESRAEAERVLRGDAERLAEVAAARSKLAKQNAEGLISDEDLAAALREYAEEAAALRESSSRARERRDSATTVSAAWERLVGDFSEGSDAEALAAEFEKQAGEAAASEWNAALRQVVSRVVLHDDRVVFEPVVGEAVTVKRERTRRKK